MIQIGLLEDNMRIANLCSTMLQYAGYKVTVYEHPQACLDALLPTIESQLRTPTHKLLPVDVLILDLHLPDMDGIAVLRSLCAHPTTQSLPIIFCTAATPAEIACALNMAPHAGFLEKPFNYPDLVAAIQSALAPLSA